MTPRQITTCIAAIVPLLGLIGLEGYSQILEMRQRYVTQEQATAAHLELSLKMIRAELRYMDSRTLDIHEKLYYSQLIEVLQSMEADRDKTLGVR